jgi:flagellar M-ring protein FliF
MSAEAATLPMVTGNNNGLKPAMLLVGLAAAIALGVGVVLWSKEPNYQLLMTKVGNDEISQITQTLDSTGIPYTTDMGSGSVSVPADRLNEARLKLAGAGLPASGGFASLTKDSGFGTSQVMETARYQYALEIELAKTIANLQPVEAARVHLAIPEQSAFIRDKRVASASVFVQLRNGRRLDPEQVNSIINLVASSIPGMDAKHVTVIDQQGRLLSSPEGDDDFAMRDRQYEFAHRLEDMYTQRIEQLLMPLVGMGNIRAQVVADVDLSVTEETREQYNPQSQVVRSEQTSEEVNRNGATGPQGVPGALTNQPPAGGTAAAPNVATNVTATQDAPGTATDTANTNKQATRNYEIDRTLAYTKQLPGHLKRLSVAVLVDNPHTTDADGKVTEATFTPEQIDSMTKLVRDAVGFDEKRGDSVNVVNSSFRAVTAEKPGDLFSTPIWERPWVRDLTKLLSGLIVLLVLIQSVIKPLIRNLTTQSRPQQLPSPQQQQIIEQQAASGGQQPKGYEQQLADARAVVNQDPARVAQVVKTWVSDNE